MQADTTLWDDTMWTAPPRMQPQPPLRMEPPPRQELLISGDDVKVVAAATRALVDAMSAPSSGALAIAPEGLRPKTAAGVSACGS